jgi:glycosyltransferase involved in cell wall biosynthesis
MGRTLQQTLDSVRAQTISPLEIIVVDDGSTDPETLEVLSRVDAQGVRLVRQINGGLSSARNAGIRVAKGRWILPLDADDLLAPRFVEKTLAVMEAEPHLAYATAFSSFFVDTPEQPVGGWIPWGGDSEFLPALNTAGSCTALLDRATVEEVGGYDPWLTTFEDWDLYLSLAARGRKGAVLPEFLFHYRIRPDSMLRTTDRRKRQRAMAFLAQKHAGLLKECAVSSLQVLMSEWEAENRNAMGPPLRYQLVDRLNDALRRLPLVGRPAAPGGSDPAAQPPRRHRLVDQLYGALRRRR